MLVICWFCAGYMLIPKFKCLSSQALFLCSILCLRFYIRLLIFGYISLLIVRICARKFARFEEKY